MELALEIVQLEQLVKETDSTLSTLILASIAELVLELAQQEQSAKLNFHYFNKAEKEEKEILFKIKNLDKGFR